MPMYNTEKYVEEAICSVLSQTYQDWELLVVDDCSTDNSVSIVNILWISILKKGYVARNTNTVTARYRLRTQLVSSNKWKYRNKYRFVLR